MQVSTQLFDSCLKLTVKLGRIRDSLIDLHLQLRSKKEFRTIISLDESIL